MKTYDAIPEENISRERMYACWHRIGKGSGWACFDDFVDWSFKNGYNDDAKLFRKDTEKPWGPDNVKWRVSTKKRPLAHAEEKECAMKWNRTVNIWRRAYGLKPFPEI